MQFASNGADAAAPWRATRERRRALAELVYGVGEDVFTGPFVKDSMRRTHTVKWMLLALLVIPAATAFQPADRVSVSSSGAQSTAAALGAWPSWDARFVAFESAASDLVAGDTDGLLDIFVRDRSTGTTVSPSAGVGGSGLSFTRASLSWDGQVVAFAGSNGVLGFSIYIQDRTTGITTSVLPPSVSSVGAPVLSGNGRYLAFWSPNALVPADTNGFYDLYVYDRQTSAFERVSLQSNNQQCVEGCGYYTEYVSISGSGRFVAWSTNSQLAPDDTSGHADVYVRDRSASQTRLVSKSSGGSPSNAPSSSPSVVDGGSPTVVFRSSATNFDPRDTSAAWDDYDVYYSVGWGPATLASVNATGAAGNGWSEPMTSLALSNDGLTLAFTSEASNLVPDDDLLATWDVFVLDRPTGNVHRVTVTSTGCRHAWAIASSSPRARRTRASGNSCSRSCCTLSRISLSSSITKMVTGRRSEPAVLAREVSIGANIDPASILGTS